MNHPSFGSLLESSWAQGVSGHPMARLSLKLKRLKPLLKGLSLAKVPDAFKDWLIRVVSAEEVRASMFSIKGNKAPGPDNLNAGFFQKKLGTSG
ncbi:hypothetical protein Acr_22g0000790 [Actinidia rufa]|uniref:Uncharacterized protein n=1 Tax=Actinidia rufa TaxID=165716 RepID=A0A7J0GIX1_9ERIC|nr:hypothetical protein Acr_22g0000790 [Actinidia rufa]